METQSFSVSKKSVSIVLEENQGEMSYEGTPVKAHPNTRRRGDAANATAKFTFIDG